MTTLYSPILDNFENTLSSLVSDIVKGWDLKTCIAFCQDNLEKNWKYFSIEELVEQYELHHDRSIVQAVIVWNDLFKTGEPNWHDYVNAECHALKHTDINTVERTNVNDDDIAFWSVYLVDHDGLSTCILDLVNKDEAEAITDSINTYYLGKPSESSE